LEVPFDTDQLAPTVADGGGHSIGRAAHSCLLHPFQKPSARVAAGSKTPRVDGTKPVNRIREVTSDDKIVLDAPADQATDLIPERNSTDTACGAESFSDSNEVEKGAWELKKENTD
jgi:hypothetical protein